MTYGRRLIQVIQASKNNNLWYNSKESSFGFSDHEVDNQEIENISTKVDKLPEEPPNNQVEEDEDEEEEEEVVADISNNFEEIIDDLVKCAKAEDIPKKDALRRSITRVLPDASESSLSVEQKELIYSTEKIEKMKQLNKDENEDGYCTKRLNWFLRNMKLESKRQRCKQYHISIRTEKQLYQLSFLPAGNFAVIKNGYHGDNDISGWVLRSIQDDDISNTYKETCDSLRSQKIFPLKLGFWIPPAINGLVNTQLRYEKTSFSLWAKTFVRVGSGRFEYSKNRLGFLSSFRIFALRGCVLSLIPKDECGFDYCMVLSFQHRLKPIYNNKKLHRHVLHLQCSSLDEYKKWCTTLLHAIAVANGELDDELQEDSDNNYLAALKRINRSL